MLCEVCRVKCEETGGRRTTSLCRNRTLIWRGKIRPLVLTECKKKLACSQFLPPGAPFSFNRAEIDYQRVRVKSSWLDDWSGVDRLLIITLTPKGIEMPSRVVVAWGSLESESGE